MASEPDNLVLSLLRDIRAVLDQHTALHRSHEQAFKDVRSDIASWTDTFAATGGLTLHANVRAQKLEKRVEELEERLKRVEEHV
jgi:methylphosphotriester-DNA--protein-cysteine methyltransferase